MAGESKGACAWTAAGPLVLYQWKRTQQPGSCPVVLHPNDQFSLSLLLRERSRWAAAAAATTTHAPNLPA